MSSPKDKAKTGANQGGSLSHDQQELMGQDRIFWNERNLDPCGAPGTLSGHPLNMCISCIVIENAISKPSKNNLVSIEKQLMSRITKCV